MFISIKENSNHSITIYSRWSEVTSYTNYNFTLSMDCPLPAASRPVRPPVSCLLTWSSSGSHWIHSAVPRFPSSSPRTLPRPALLWNKHGDACTPSHHQLWPTTSHLCLLHLHSSRSWSCCISLSSCSSMFCLSFPVSDFPRDAILQNTRSPTREEGNKKQNNSN